MRPLWFLVLVAVALIGSRLAGVRLGLWRSLLAAWLGIATAGVSLTVLTRSGKEGDPSTILVIGIGLLAMMAWVGIFELASRALPEPVRQSFANPLSSVKRRLARGKRKIEIALIIARSGLVRFGRRRAREPRGAAVGRSLRGVLQRAGGVYIKLGQFLSTRPDLVSAEIAAELGLLQQDADPVPTSLIDRVFSEELGVAPSALFAEFNPQPSAAASIAQVHAAVLFDGRRVAVKIQRPDVAEGVRRDLDILTRLARRLERRTHWALDLHLSEVVRGFAESVTGELDFKAEADNLITLSKVIQRHPRYVVPLPHSDLTRKRVLVMEWVDGVRLADAATSLSTDDRHDLARSLLRCFLDQLLVSGTFHADPHPGNLFLLDDGRVGLLDCGSIGRLNRRQRSTLQAILFAVGAQDGAQLRDALRRITTSRRSVEGELLERALSDVLARHLGPAAMLGGALFNALMDVMREFGLALDPVVGGALRALATLQSTLGLIDPQLDLLEEATSYGRTLLLPPGWPTSPRSVRDEFEAIVPTLLPMLQGLPRRLDRITEAMERNEIVLGVHLFPEERDRRFATRLMASLVVTVAGASAGVIGGLLILAANPRLTTDAGRMLQALGIGCVAVALLGLLRALAVALRDLRER